MKYLILFFLLTLGCDQLNKPPKLISTNILWLKCIKSKTNNCLGVKIYDLLSEKCKQDPTYCKYWGEFEDIFGAY